MAISYAGLPGKRCSECSGTLFARFTNEIRCVNCQPVVSGSQADEFLESRYDRGVLRWFLSLPPEPPTIPTVWLYVADDLEWLECEPSDEIAEACHVGPASTGQWYRKLDRQLFAWFVERVHRVKAQFFAEDYEDVLTKLRSLVARAIEVGALSAGFTDESKWPRAVGVFNPFENLPDLSQINFPGLRQSPAVPSSPNPFAGFGGRNA